MRYSIEPKLCLEQILSDQSETEADTFVGSWHCPSCVKKMQFSHDSHDSDSLGNPGFANKEQRKQLTKQRQKAKPRIPKVHVEKKSDRIGIQAPNLDKEDRTSKAAQNMRKPKKDSKPWKNPEEIQRVIELLQSFQSDQSIPHKLRYSETKWKKVAKMLEFRYGFHREADAIKNKWVRDLREKTGYDERKDQNKKPDKMRTSVESPECRKRKRQIQAKGELAVPRKKRPSMDI